MSGARSRCSSATALPGSWRGRSGTGETVTADIVEVITMRRLLEGLYIRLEDAYRDAGVREALEDMDDPLAALQDAFFVLRRGVDRAVGTLSEQAALAELHRTLATLALDADVFQAAASLATRGETKELSLIDAVDEEVRGASIESLAIAAGGAFACASSVAALKDEVVGELARSVPLAVPLLDDFDHSSHQYDELAAGALSALFDEPGLMLSRRRFFADVVDDKMGQVLEIGRQGRPRGRRFATGKCLRASTTSCSSKGGFKCITGGRAALGVVSEAGCGRLECGIGALHERRQGRRPGGPRATARRAEALRDTWWIATVRGVAG